MRGKRLRRLGAAGAVLLCLVAVLAGAAASAPPEFTVGDVTSDEQDGDMQFTVTLTDPAPAGGVALKYSTANGTATAGSDYEAKTNADVPVIAEGDKTATFTVPLEEDARDEPNETFTVTVKHAEGGDKTATGTITDDDAPPSVTIGDATVTEGDSGDTPANFNVQLSTPSGKSVVVRYDTVNGSATSPSDFDGGSGQITIAPGQAGGTITVNVNGDEAVEPNEQFTVVLTSADNATVPGGSQGVGTINNDDSAPTVSSVGDASVTEGNSGEVDADFVVTLSKAAPGPVAIRYSTTASSATSPSDYDGVTNGTLNIPAGQSSGTITIKVNGDTVPEGTGNPRAETFFVDLLSATGATLGSDTRGTGTIVDDDTPPTVTSISDPTVTEGNAGTVDANFVVTLSGNAPSPVAIRYSTLDGTAKSPDDYDGVTNQTLNIAAGANQGTITIEVKGDTIPEGTNENFFVDLLSATGATLGSDTRGTATITDDDAQRSLTVTGAEVTEGDGGTVNLDFKVKLSGTTAQRVEVTATTADGSAVAPADYQAKTQVLVWAPNTPADELEKTFRVLVNGDTLDEPSEGLTVTLSAPQNATIAVPAAAGTIRDNDNRSLLSISNAEANEGVAGAKSTMTFKVTLAPVSARPVALSYATANGTAAAGSDYEAKSGQLNFAPGETEKTVEITILGDDVNEENETVLVNLSNIAGAGLSGGGGQGHGTIVDKNAPPSLSIDDVQARESEGATFTVTLAGTTLKTVTVTFGTNDGSAKQEADYTARRGTLTFAPGEKTKTIVVTVRDDTDPETAETFSVGLGNPVNGVITKASGIATIEASDGPVGSALGSGGGGLNNDRVGSTPPLSVTKPAAVKKAVFPQMVLGPRVVNLLSGRAGMVVTCRRTSPLTCAGSIALLTTTKPALKLGEQKFSVRKGRKAQVSIVLSRPALKLLEKVRTLQVKVVVFVKTSTKRNVRVEPGTITVKMGKTAAARRP